MHLYGNRWRGSIDRRSSRRRKTEARHEEHAAPTRPREENTTELASEAMALIQAFSLFIYPTNFGCGLYDRFP